MRFKVDLISIMIFFITINPMKKNNEDKNVYKVKFYVVTVSFQEKQCFSSFSIRGRCLYYFNITKSKNKIKETNVVLLKENKRFQCFIVFKDKIVIIIFCIFYISFLTNSIMCFIFFLKKQLYYIVCKQITFVKMI